MTRWPVVPLQGHIVEVSIRKGDSPAEILSVTNTDGFVRSLDVFDKQVFSQDASNYKRVGFNDIAYNPSRINVGSVARCDLPDGGAVSPMYVVVRCRGTLSPEYLLYFLKSDVGQRHIVHRSVGAVRFMLRFGDLERIELPLPPRSDQERIVRALNEAAALNRLRVHADERTLAISAALFDRDFGGEGRSWPHIPLAVLVDPGDKINYGVVQPGNDVIDGIPLVRAGDIEETVSRKESLKRIDPLVESAYARSRLKGGEVLLTCVGQIGRVGLADASLRGCNIARAVARIPVGPQLDPAFLVAFLNSPAGQRYLIGEARTQNQPTLNIREIESLATPVPPIESQRMFGSRIAAIRRLASAQGACRQRLDALFQSLLHHAFQGEL